MTIKEFHFSLPNTPGALASIAKRLGSAGINIYGGLGYAYNKEGYICIITDNAPATANTLEEAEISFTTGNAIVTNLENVPGALAKITQALADEDINITAFYVTMGNKVAFGTDNPEGAAAVAKKLGILEE